MSDNARFETVCNVCPEYGTITPIFRIGNEYSSGYLKYFQSLGGKKVRVTIEVIDEDSDTQDRR